MNRTKYLKGECTECGGRLEYPAEAIGTTTDCPHCGKPTELQLEAPKHEPVLSTRIIVWTIIAVLILGGGLVGALIALKRAQHLVAERKERATPNASTPTPSEPVNVEPIVTNNFKVSPVALEKVSGSSLVYAVGTAINMLNEQRFGIQVQLDLYNLAGQKIGTAKDYHQLLEPNAEWKFKALVMESKATSAKLAVISEKN